MPHFAPGVNPIVGCILAVLGVLVVGISKSGFGGGMGILAVPCFALAFGAQAGTGILLPILFLADIFSVPHHWKKWHSPTLRALAPGTLCGVLIGTTLLYLLIYGLPGSAATTQPIDDATRKAAMSHGERPLKMMMGIVCVLFVILEQVRQRWAPKWKLSVGKTTGFAAGTAVGITSTLANAAGPVAAIFLLGSALPRAAFLGTTVIYFFCLNGIKLIPYISLGLTNFHTLAQGLWFLPLVPVGTFLGVFLSRRMSETVFRNTILITVAIAGLQLSYEAYTGQSILHLILPK